MQLSMLLIYHIIFDLSIAFCNFFYFFGKNILHFAIIYDIILIKKVGDHNGEKH